MKKFATIVISLILVLCLSLVFVACDGKNNDNDTNNELSRTEISQSFKAIAKSAYTQLGFNPDEESASTASLPEIGEEANTTGSKHILANAISMVAYIDFVGDLYANENFVITDKNVKFEVQNPAITFEMCPVLDEANNHALIEMIVKQGTAHIYFNFDLDFDFEKGTLNSMAIGIAELTDTGLDNIQCQRMKDGKLYLAYGSDVTMAYSNAISSVYSDFTSKTDTIAINGYFDTEYSNYSAISQKAWQQASQDYNSNTIKGRSARATFLLRICF